MVGGEPDAVALLEPMLATLSPGGRLPAGTAAGRAAGASAAALGYLHCGPHGAGHFVKMVHNGIEYGLMAAYAEGLNILAHADAGLQSGAADAETAPLANPHFYQYQLNVAAIAELWRHGSIITSRLLDLTAGALARGWAAGGLRRARRGFGRGALDGAGGDRRRRTRLRAVGGALLALRIAWPRGFRRQGAVGDALRLRWPRREERLTEGDRMERRDCDAARPVRSDRGPVLSQDPSRRSTASCGAAFSPCR